MLKVNFSVLSNIGLTSEVPVRVAEGVEIAPLKVLKALLPDPASLAPGYVGKTCIGNFIKGTKDNQERSIFIYNICDHAECYKELEAQALASEKVQQQMNGKQARKVIVVPGKLVNIVVG
jgi:saccharopine dehydrogenase-like NADP-dependent oxidoreductase